MEKNYDKYVTKLSQQFTKYAAVKLSLNYFTMKEMTEGISLDKEEIAGYISILDSTLNSVVDNDEAGNEELLEKVTAVRDAITKKMKVLTAYTDSLEIYEYIINRKEALVKGTSLDDIDTEALSDDLFKYVFSENDKFLINSKIQAIIAQLPVRMTRDRFIDVVDNTISIYTGGERSSLDSFIETLYDGALLNIPEGFETEYRDLYDIYNTVKSFDYKNITLDDYVRLTGLLTSASEIIQAKVTNYMMLQEVVNDILILLYTYPMVEREKLGKDYETACEILKGIVTAEDLYKAAVDFDRLFVNLEGVQEQAYYDLSKTESKLDDYIAENESKDDFDKAATDALKKADLLTANSLFMDIEAVTNTETGVCDEEYINSKKQEFAEKITEYFKTLTKLEKRSVMAKLLSMLPVFFNSQEEIKRYFAYSLSNCTDMSELTACDRILRDMMYE